MVRKKKEAEKEAACCKWGGVTEILKRLEREKGVGVERKRETQIGGGIHPNGDRVDRKRRRAIKRKRKNRLFGNALTKEGAKIEGKSESDRKGP